MATIPAVMTGVHLTGYGGLEKLEYRSDIPTPQPGPDEVLIQVTAAGVNNTDINTRVGWYSKSVKTGTTTEGATDGFGLDDADSGSWSGGLSFPRIQGADCVGRIAAVGSNVSPDRVGERVVVSPYTIDPDDETELESGKFLGSEMNGAFAQFVPVKAENAVKVSDTLTLSDEQLATLPCSGGTAMNMLLMAGAKKGDLALVTGASGGVGTFLVQILKHLGAEVVAVSGKSKWDLLKDLGADHLIDRNTDDLVTSVHAATSGRDVTLVADVVGGPQFEDMLTLLRVGGRYVTAGAIAGPEVTLDLRTLYLKTLSFFGSTVYRKDCFPTLVRIAEKGGLNPPVAGIHPLSEIKEIQTQFLEKSHVGSFVLKPPPT